MTRLVRLAVATALVTYALIVLGGITRVTDSGMGCADDWPRCHGRWLPPLEPQPIIEYLHRLFGVTVGLLVIATAAAALLTSGVSRRTRLVATLALPLVIFQGLLGAVTVRLELEPSVVVVHLGTAMIFFGVTLMTVYLAALDRGGPRWLVAAGRELGDAVDRRFQLVARLGVLAIFLLIISGASTSTTGAALACPSWPLCTPGELIPSRTSVYTWLNLGHRLVALVGTAAIVATVVAAQRRAVPRAARQLSALAVGVLVVQIVLGGAYVVTGGSPWLGAAHLATATLLWAVMLALAIVGVPETVATFSADAGLPAAQLRPAGRGVAMRSGQTLPLQMDAEAVSAGGGALALTPAAAFPLRWPDLGRARAVAADYLALTKPGILTLLLATTLCAMVIAAAALPPFGLVLATLLGGALAAGGANVINCYCDRDIDAQMARTRHRATVSGRITPAATLRFGVGLTALAVVLLGLATNWLAAGLALLGNLYYVFVYTKWLKRTTPHNIVIGGAAGAVPPLVGWAAVTGDLSPLAWALFAVIFMWTPPHFWALALLKQGEYGRAAVPMLPVVAGEAETRRQILLYSLLLFAVCLLLGPLGLGPIYVAAAVVLNGIFLGLALRLFLAPSKRLARRLFFFSLWYLALIFAAAVVDRLLLA